MTEESTPILDPVAPRRSPKLIAAGISLIAVSALGGLAFSHAANSTHDVLALASDIPRGETIQETDLVSVSLSDTTSGLNTISTAEENTVVGQIATSDLHAGATLTLGDYADTLGLETDTSLVGVSVSSAQAPASALHSGDTVLLVQSATTGMDTIEEPLTWTGTVVSVHSSDTDSSVRIVDVQIPTTDAAKVASLAAGGQIALVLQSAEQE